MGVFPANVVLPSAQIEVVEVLAAVVGGTFTVTEVVAVTASHPPAAARVYVTV